VVTSADRERLVPKTSALLLANRAFLRHNGPMSETLNRIVHSHRFHHFITAVILFAAVLVGIETYPEMVARYGRVLHVLDGIVLAIFVVEIVMKMGAEGSRPWRYFRDPWNVFDFVIVAIVFLPIDSQYVTVLRLARLLRVLRLVRAVPRLQILVGALLKAIPSMGYVSLLLFLMFYIYAVAAVFLFGKNDPFRFGDLPTAFVTLFQVATAEEWVQTLNTQRYGCNVVGYEGREAMCTHPTAYPILAPIYFISFILVGTMVILNLFIGVIMNGMEEAETEQQELTERERLERAYVVDSNVALDEDLKKLEAQIEGLTRAVRSVAARARARIPEA
jgi:voltage-gated sodium channel